ncbi:MAG: DUF4956 domain-containing protein [Eubacteriales bacterium]
MLDSLFYSTTEDTVTLPALVAAIGAALLLGLVISLVYMLTHRAEGYSGSFIVTLIMLPTIISVIILLIGSNVARAFSLAGAFSLIRYRSAPGDPKDIAYVFFALAVGLACGMGFIPYAAIFTAILCLVMVVLHFTNFAKPKASHMQLTVTVPENLNYQGLFDDVLDRYTDSWKLKRVKTSDFGTLFDVVYNIHMKSSADQKKFIDELRCRNGNLTISLTLKEYETGTALA